MTIDNVIIEQLNLPARISGLPALSRAGVPSACLITPSLPMKPPANETLIGHALFVSVQIDKIVENIYELALCQLLLNVLSSSSHSSFQLRGIQALHALQHVGIDGTLYNNRSMSTLLLRRLHVTSL
jgi:hypothetical protein